MIFALGFLVLLVQFVSLARTAFGEARYVTVSLTDSWTGGRYLARRRREPEAEAPLPRLEGPYRLPLASPAQLAAALAAAVVSLAAFFPQVVDASETSIRYTHLDNAGIFFFGAMLGLALGSLPAVSRVLGDHSSLGLAAVVVAPPLMMLTMVPSIYAHFEPHPAVYAYYLVHNAVLGLLTGLGATRLGLVTGRIAIVLSIGMALMFAGTAGG